MPQTIADRAALSKSSRPGFYYGYVIVAAGFIIWFTVWGIHQSFGVFLKPLLEEFTWDRADVVLAYSIVGLIQACLNIFMGWLTDRLGPRFVITVFGSLAGIAYLLLSRITELWQFQLIFSLTAITNSATMIALMATIARWFIKKQAFMTSIVQAGVGLGGFFFAPLTAWLVVTYGWRPAYAVLGIIALSAIIIPGLLFRRDPREIGRLPDGETMSTGAETRQRIARTQVGGLSLRQAIRTRPFWVLVAIFFAFGFCRSTFLPHIAAYVQDAGFTLTDGANVIAILTVSSILGRLSMGRVGSRAAFVAAFALTTLSLVWGMYTRQIWGLYLFAFAFGIGWGAQAVLRFTAAAQTFGLASIGLLLGALTFAESLASAGGSYFAGWAFDITGSYDPAFISGIAISLAGVVLTWRLKTAPIP
ncbi:MAG: MFS transporter [Chloroflexi bacterium]|nr:MFS transporter [Chloroflexota bacterium]